MQFFAKLEKKVPKFDFVAFQKCTRERERERERRRP